MPRQAKWVAVGVYQPTYQPRHAYGRRWYTRELVEDYSTAVGVIHARQIARYAQGAAMPAYLEHLAGVPVVSVPMPRGGYRLLLVCPICQKRATRLYGRYHAGYRRYTHACRTCWGLRYRSQYAGRRIEAHPDYLQAVMRRQIARTPAEPRGYLPVLARRQMARIRHILRMGRYQRAHDLLDARTYRHMQRGEIATDLAILTLLARCWAKERRHWQKVIRQVLRDGNTDAMRQLIAMKDAPEWARETLQEALNQVEMARKATITALKVAEKCELTAIIEQEQLDALRATYAALGQGRRAKRAA